MTEPLLSCSADSVELEIELIELAICRTLAAHETGLLNCQKVTMNYEAFQLKEELPVDVVRHHYVDVQVRSPCLGR